MAEPGSSPQNGVAAIQRGITVKKLTRNSPLCKWFTTLNGGVNIFTARQCDTSQPNLHRTKLKRINSSSSVEKTRDALTLHEQATQQVAKGTTSGSAKGTSGT
jgi:hypothetical protein